jgi:hypothetical protein
MIGKGRPQNSFPVTGYGRASSSSAVTIGPRITSLPWLGRGGGDPFARLIAMGGRVNEAASNF